MRTNFGGKFRIGKAPFEDKLLLTTDEPEINTQGTWNNIGKRAQRTLNHLERSSIALDKLLILFMQCHKLETTFYFIIFVVN